MEELIFDENLANKGAMENYLRNQFIFCGVKSPERKILEAPYLKMSLKLPISELFDLIKKNYAKKEREYHYYAIDLAIKNARRLTFTQLHDLVPLVTDKAWWDSVDTLKRAFAEWVKKNPTELEKVFSWFYAESDFWLRRMSLILQLGFKETTSTSLLEKAIVFDAKTDEFFIQKAIGWALRDYSKTNPTWVKGILQSYPLSTLAIREASKYL